MSTTKDVHASATPQPASSSSSLTTDKSDKSSTSDSKRIAVGDQGSSSSSSPQQQQQSRFDDPFAVVPSLGFGGLLSSPFDLGFGFGGPSIFDRSLMRPFERLDRAVAEPMRQLDESMRMNMDFSEHGDKYQLSVDLPGVPKDNVKLDVRGRQLTVTAERQDEKKDEKTGWYSKSSGKTSRTITLPANSDTERVNATIVNGQLRITLPKKEVAPDNRSIKIE